jgi:hypothetical protein
LLVRKPIQLRPHVSLPESKRVNQWFIDSSTGLLGLALDVLDAKPTVVPRITLAAICSP